MRDDREDQQERREDDAAIEDGDDGGQDEVCGDGPRMQGLVEDVERGSGYRQGEENSEQADSGPDSGAGGKASAGQRPAGVEQEKSSEVLADEFRNGKRDVGDADPGGDEAIEDAGLHLPCKEREIVRVERGMKAVLDGGEVDAIVFDSRMVPLDEQSRGGEESQ